MIDIKQSQAPLCGWLLQRVILFLGAFETTTMGFHVSIAGTHISVPRSPWWDTVAPLAASVAGPYAHLMP